MLEVFASELAARHDRRERLFGSVKVVGRDISGRVCVLSRCGKRQDAKENAAEETLHKHYSTAFQREGSRGGQGKKGRRERCFARAGRPVTQLVPVVGMESQPELRQTFWVPVVQQPYEECSTEVGESNTKWKKSTFICKFFGREVVQMSPCVDSMGFIESAGKSERYGLVSANIRFSVAPGVFKGKDSNSCGARRCGLKYPSWLSLSISLWPEAQSSEYHFLCA